MRPRRHVIAIACALLGCLLGAADAISHWRPVGLSGDFFDGDFRFSVLAILGAAQMGGRLYHPALLPFEGFDFRILRCRIALRGRPSLIVLTGGTPEQLARWRQSGYMRLYLSLPMVLVWAFLALPWACVAVRTVRRRRTDRCVECGYRLLGSTGDVCPECGFRKTRKIFGLF